MYSTLIVNICALILNKLFGFQIEIDPHIIFTTECPETGLQEHYKLEVLPNYIEVRMLKPIVQPAPQQINYLLSNIYDLETWMEIIPPDNVQILGVAVIQMIDITEEESISRLKYKLIEKDAVLTKENVTKLEELLRSYFQLPDIKLGITALDYPIDKSQYRYQLRHDLLAEHQECLLDPDNANSIYEKVCKYCEVMVVSDLQALEHPTPIEKGLLELGLRSIMVASLLDKEGEVIGLLEVASQKPFILNSINEVRFRDILPLFSMAMERSREEIDNRIEVIIREQFTALHPSVEWKFQESASQMMQSLQKGEKKPGIDPILFEDIYPLYAQADIVNSSILRNNAIQEDFIDNLRKVRRILQDAAEIIDFPLIGYYLSETDRLIDELSHEIRSNDETRLMDFIRGEIHPLFAELAARSTKLSLHIDRYYEHLDPQYGVIYKNRKHYEQSVDLINEAISEFLEQEEKRTQQMVPHYFEKYKTDGVEFELYAGQSLLRKGEFTDMHLRNLRLWQLIAIAEVSRKVLKMREELPVPLQTAQLVFVYNHPIAIRFRMDEKRFDVDGTYNVRYEIIKKRIDKATIEGRSERLTQAGKIAIVYTTEKDRLEYLEYLNYMVRQGYIEDKIEDLTLERLQGVQGLRGLRVTVKNEVAQG